MANDSNKNSDSPKNPGIFGTTPIWKKDDDSDKKRNDNSWGNSRDNDDD